MAYRLHTRAELIAALQIASEIEHSLMCQYLCAVYSLKRYPYEGLEPQELERVRRMASSMTLIARQEMEHLGLALNRVPGRCGSGSAAGMVMCCAPISAASGRSRWRLISDGIPRLKPVRFCTQRACVARTSSAPASAGRCMSRNNCA